MPNTVTQTTLFSGTGIAVRKIDIVSDGSEETDLVILDRSTFDSVTDNGRVMKVMASGSSCQLQLKWDQTTDSPIINMDPAYTQKMCFAEFGGIKNPGATGATGDILLTTTNLDNGDVVSLIITVRLT